MRILAVMREDPTEADQDSDAGRYQVPFFLLWGCFGLPGRPRWPGSRRGLWWVLAGCLLLQCTQPVQVGQKAPDFVLESLRGTSVSLAALRGKVVILHFWATWCPPCLTELPAIMRFVEALDEGKYTLLAVCVDNEDPRRIREFLHAWGADVPAYLDPGGSLARRYGTVRFPETYVLDQEGVVCQKVIGAGDWTILDQAHILHNCTVNTDERKMGPDPGATLLPRPPNRDEFCSGIGGFCRKTGKVRLLGG